MSNSQDQSLDEDVVFPLVTESSPGFLYCEKERQAVERLLSAGPEAFYGSVGTERSGCFLSPEEVSHLSGWAQDYRFNQLHAERETQGDAASSGTEDACSTYFPHQTDTPAPDLDLGWPEKLPWVPAGSVSVYTSPPADGEPPVREIIRWHLQKASHVVAIATDRLTDCTIIADLHNAATRGVPVYIILNQRSIQENFTLNRLRHPNMRVRVLGGKAFCSRTGRMVVGEMKNKFLLVDLETVILGSYSLTWTDAHLHRQLITVLSGPVVDSFDREFRILFAASSPVSETWRSVGSPVEVTHQLKDFSNLKFQQLLPSESDVTSPPSPPTDYLLDWEAMGVLHRDAGQPDSPCLRHEEILPLDVPKQNNVMFQERNAPAAEIFAYNGNQFVEKRLHEKSSPVTNNVPERSTLFNNTQPFLTHAPKPERMKSEEVLTEKVISRRLSTERRSSFEEKPPRFEDKASEPQHSKGLLSPTRRQRSRTEGILEEDHGSNGTRSKVENTPSSRKPLILRLPQSDNFSSLSDLMKRIQPRQSTAAAQSRGSKTAVSELSQSMMDLSVHKTETNNVPVPRFKPPRFDTSQILSSMALMKKRNDDLKSVLFATPKNFIPKDRPRSSSYGLDWRRSLAELDGDPEKGAGK